MAVIDSKYFLSSEERESLLFTPLLLNNKIEDSFFSYSYNDKRFNSGHNIKRHCCLIYKHNRKSFEDTLIKIFHFGSKVFREISKNDYNAFYKKSILALKWDRDRHIPHLDVVDVSDRLKYPAGTTEKNRISVFDRHIDNIIQEQLEVLPFSLNDVKTSIFKKIDNNFQNYYDVKDFFNVYEKI